MSTWCALLTGSEQSHRSWKRNCSVTPTSASITENPSVEPWWSGTQWDRGTHARSSVSQSHGCRVEKPLNERGLRVLGCPIGSPEYVAARLNAKSEEQRSLFQRIPLVADLHAAWVLLFYCGATRANFWLRNVQPAQTFWYAQQHDDNVWDCFSRLTGFSQESPEARLTSSVPLGKGGLGLLSAVRIREAAHWASWADSLPMVHRRHPEVARMMVGGLARGAASCFTAVRGCV